MYDYGYGYDSYDYGAAANAVGIFAGVSILMWIIGMAVVIFSVVCMWKVFTKAGKKGWASIIPIYNMVVMIEIAELPMWYIALFFVPLANIYAMFKIYIEIAHKFGKSTGFGIGLIFLGVIFMPMLAFGKAEYKGNSQQMPNNNSNLVNDSNLQGQFNTNGNFNMQNNGSQFNVMDVNNGIGVGSMNDFNMQSNGSIFQPAGDVNNNIYNNDINLMSNVSPNNINGNLNNVNNMSFNNNGMMTDSVNNGIPAMPEQNVMPNQNMNMASQPVDVINANNGMMSNSVNNLVNNGIPAVPEQNQITSVNNMKKMCPHCGTQLDFNTMVCSHCGNSL